MILCASVFSTILTKKNIDVYYLIYYDHTTRFNFRIDDEVYCYEMTPKHHVGSTKKIVNGIKDIIECAGWIMEQHDDNAFNFASSFRAIGDDYSNYIMHHACQLLMQF